MQILYGNADITQLAIMNCMENNIIFIPSDAKTREYLFGPTSSNSINVNGHKYSNDIFIDFKTSEVYAKYPVHLNQPKIVVLIICHYSEMNIMMLEQLRNNIYRKHKIKYYIVASRYSDKDTKDKDTKEKDTKETDTKETEKDTKKDTEKDTEPIVLDDDIIFVNQKETYFNILNKTLKAMEYIDNVLKLDYDFMIRTNVSTVINVPQLLKELAPLPRKNISIGGNKMHLNWICPSYGITDNRYKGRCFIQGTGIIFSKDVCQDIVKNQHKIEKTIVDDISLFMYLGNFNPIAYESVHNHAVSFYECSESLDQLHLIPKNYAFYRNKSETMRDEDITRMRYLCTNGNLKTGQVG